MIRLAEDIGRGKFRNMEKSLIISLVALVVLSLFVAAGCLGFGEREITQEELPQDYPTLYNWNISYKGEEGLFVITNIRDVPLKNAKVKIEVTREGNFSFSMAFLGDINPGETKEKKIEAEYMFPTRILIWHEDIKSWVIIYASERFVVKIDTSSWRDGSLKVSPDSKRVAYAALVGNKRFVVVDGKEGKRYDGIIVMGGGKIVFDVDSIYYLAIKGEEIYLVEEKFG